MKIDKSSYIYMISIYPWVKARNITIKIVSKYTDDIIIKRYDDNENGYTILENMNGS